MTEIWLARHAETDWNRAERYQGDGAMPLNARGRRQAAALATTLHGADIAAVYASDLPRAAETAVIITAALALPPPALDPRLRERALGPFQGLTYAEAAARTGRVRNAAGWVDLVGLPGVEDDAAVLARLLAAFDDVGERWPDARVLVIGHGSAMAAIQRGVPGGGDEALVNGAILRLRGARAGWMWA